MKKAAEIPNDGFFKQIYDGWLQFAELAGRFNTKIIVSMIYFLLVSISWFFISACTRKQLLDRCFRVSKSSVWIERTEKENQVSIDQLRHQF